MCACGFVALAGCYHRPNLEEDQPVDLRPSALASQSGDQQPARHFSGVDLVPTQNGGFAIHLLSGFALNHDPLYIIDGAPMTIDPIRGIDWFKIEDIADLKVVKDPAELAVYGPRGVNGVVVITTRQAPGRKRRS
jgi:TonB-dependent SusC/RagA subfamily outer membrane receptor